MTTAPFDVERYADEMAALLGLDIRPEWRDSVIENLKATRAVAAIVLSVPLDDHIEPAPVFEA